MVTDQPARPWLNRTVVGIGLASLCSDWSHEIATAVLPSFLATMGAAAAWLGFIEGAADGLASFAKLMSGFYSDRLPRRKPIAVTGYILTALGTASLGFAANAWQVLAARSTAWLGRGVRTPVRKALLAAAVTREAYGRAFGFERMMDTIGAIVGPITALILLQLLQYDYARIFTLTVIPGLAAAALMAFAVQERGRVVAARERFRASVRALPPRFRRLLVAVGLFGLGDFAHTLLILLAVQQLTPLYGATVAVTAATGLYILHNALYAAFSMVAGAVADRMNKGRLLALGYALAGSMALAIVLLPPGPWTLGLIFVLGGVSVAVCETAEDSYCAELVDDAQHGMAFGTLATVNGIGDFASSLVVGALWSAFGAPLAFAYSAALLLVGALMVLRSS
ncbi:MAG TPA: MFS transporter [Steroidobacteraceae bacterium]|nr:MFS transporter [Steroidobacteraceae bacterium]